MDHAARFFQAIHREDLLHARAIFKAHAVGTHASKFANKEISIDIWFEDWTKITLTNEQWEWVRGW